MEARDNLRFLTGEIRDLMQNTSRESLHHEVEQLRTRNPEQQNATTMNAPTREEIDAKLQLIEVGMDNRVASIERAVASSIEASGQTRNEIRSLKWTLIGTAVATVLAIAAFNATVLSNMVASFESGKNTATSQADIKATQAEVKRQTEETAALLRRMQDDLASKQPASAVQAPKK